MTSFNDYRIFNENILLITFGGSKQNNLTKARIKKINDRNEFYYQEERIIDNKAYHENIESGAIEEKFLRNITEDFKNAVIFTEIADFYIRRTKKGDLSVVKKAPTKSGMAVQFHNIQKNYIISEGKPVPFLIELGIMSSNGGVVKNNFSKFRQINRFLELIDDEYEEFSGLEEIKIFDLCCGKGYLTLAMQYYFSVIKGRKTVISGIDLKKDVISNLNNIVYKLNLSNITFKYGDINDADILNPDLVVALHACDTATDIALAKAVKAKSKLIMAVPCCQHELFNQIHNKKIDPILKYGIMKDKFTELSTNALRGLALEASGYNVEMIEFTSLEHTMKNIMIKALKSSRSNPEKINEFNDFSEYLNAKSAAVKIFEQ